MKTIETKLMSVAGQLREHRETKAKMKIEQIRIDYNQLHVALGDSRQLDVAYPILARHGLMERTSNGYKAIDPEAVIRRCHELIDRLADCVIQSA